MYRECLTGANSVGTRTPRWSDILDRPHTPPAPASGCCVHAHALDHDYVRVRVRVRVRVHVHVHAHARARVHRECEAGGNALARAFLSEAWRP